MHAEEHLGHLDGSIELTSGDSLVQRTVELMGRGALIVHVPALPHAMRGRLAQHIDDYVESELALRGSPSPWLADWSEMPRDAAARLADQLFRARTLGSSGVAIALGRLAEDDVPLSPEDSATMVMLAQTTSCAPLVVMLDEMDAGARGYGAPVSLMRLIDTGDSLRSSVDVHVHEHVHERRGGRFAPPVHVHEEESFDFDDHSDQALTDPLPVHAQAHEDANADANGADAVEEDRLEEPVAVPAPAPVVVPVAVAKPIAARAQVIAESRPPMARGWRSAVDALAAARGPMPLSAFEKHFVEAYVPLTAAIEEGLDDPRALRAHDDFRRAFEHAYTEAFQAFGATTRRPKLVMDLYDFANKQARLHNARSSHVLVVDSMRWDLGLMFRDAFGGAALCAETIMCSSLPTTTLRQLETLARGIDALRDPQTLDAIESLRGRSADTVRRLRVGSRELFKLDTIPAMLETAADFEEMMEHVIAAVNRHVETLAPRTLLVVAGDHGFTLDKNGISAHGGASPEEVLVPALAYLVGDLH